MMPDAVIPGKIPAERQKTRWKDSCKIDKKSLGLKVENVMDRTKCRREIQNYSSNDPR